MSGRKTVLIVDDDPGTLYVLANGLSTVLAMFDVITAANGREAIEALEERQVDVMVTDLAMPVMDGFSLIAYVTNRRSSLPVVVLSGLAPHSMDQRLAGYGGLRVLRKPAGYQEVAQCVLEEIERVDLGQVEGIPLASVLQLIEAERRSCSVVVTSGKRRGRLQFESGRLVNAFSDDFGAEGEAAAYDILSWSDTAIEFEHLPNNLRKLIHTPMQLMLIELAVVQDKIRNQTDAGGAGDAAPAHDAEPVAEGGAETGDGEHGADDTHDADAPDADDPDAPDADDPDADDADAVGPVGAHDAEVVVLEAADGGTPADGPGTSPGASAPPAAVTPAEPTKDAPSAAEGAPERPHGAGGIASIAARRAAWVVEEGEGPRLPPHVRLVTAPDPRPSHLDSRAAGRHAASGGAEATKHAMTGNGEAMRPDSTDDQPMRTDPQTTHDGALPVDPEAMRPEPRSRPESGSAPSPTSLDAAPNGEDGPAPAPAAEAVRDPEAPPSPDSTGETDASSTPALGPAGDHIPDMVADMVAAVTRLAKRAREADEALAAVAAEVEAFRAAQRRFDEANARREERRRELETFRDDVARLAREIIGRVDGMFDAMADADAVPDAPERDHA